MAFLRFDEKPTKLKGGEIIFHLYNFCFILKYSTKKRYCAKIKGQERTYSAAARQTGARTERKCLQYVGLDIGQFGVHHHMRPAVSGSRSNNRPYGKKQKKG